MPIWDSLRGHTEQRDMFRRAMSRGRLSQSYLFLGPDGIGKQMFARKLAQCLLCLKLDPADPLEPCGECAGCRPFLAGSHPDFLYAGCPEGKKEFPIALLVGSDERRGQEGLCHDLSLAPLPGSRKVAIVNDADTMNEAAANSFLKTLEEPPARAVLLLIASNLDALLPTIRSRCQLVRFSPLRREDVEELLLEQDLVQSKDEASFAAGLCDGSLSVASQLLDPELKALRSLLYTQLAAGQFSAISLAKQLTEGLSKITGETAQQRRIAHWLIRFTAEFFRSALWNMTGRSAESSAIPESRRLADRYGSGPEACELLGAAIDRTAEASGHLDQNVPVALSLETLTDDLGRILHAPLVAR